jgi:hypothetical protein
MGKYIVTWTGLTLFFFQVVEPCVDLLSYSIFGLALWKLYIFCSKRTVLRDWAEPNAELLDWFWKGTEISGGFLKLSYESKFSIDFWSCCREFDCPFHVKKQPICKCSHNVSSTLWQKTTKDLIQHPMPAATSLENSQKSTGNPLQIAQWSAILPMYCKLPPAIGPILGI